MDQRKSKRKISNRESARRSRVRKQKHLDDLMVQLAQHRKSNNQLVTIINVTTQHLLNVEAENSILRAQMAELDSRLESLNEIIGFLDVENEGFAIDEDFSYNVVNDSADLFMLNVNSSMSYMFPNQLPIMASADMLQY